jgi:purine-binding chemotaxis protein CheW
MEAVCFAIENQLFAVDIQHAITVVRMCYITEIPDAPPYLMGVINVRGSILPVLNTRKLIHYAEKEPDLTDQLLICQKADRAAALWVDEVKGIKNVPSDAIISAQDIDTHLTIIDQAWKDDWTVTFIINMDELLSIPIESKPKQGKLRL